MGAHSRGMLRISLGDQDRDRLLQVAGNHPYDKDGKKALAILLLSAPGARSKTLEQIARECGISEPTLRRSVDRYRKHGVEGALRRDSPRALNERIVILVTRCYFDLCRLTGEKPSVVDVHLYYSLLVEDLESEGRLEAGVRKVSYISVRKCLRRNGLA